MIEYPCFDAPWNLYLVHQISAFVRTEAASLRKEVGFGWAESRCGPTTLDELRRAIASSHCSGLPMPVPINRSVLTVFDRLETDLACAFWCYSRHAMLGVELDPDGRLTARSNLLARFLGAGADSRSPEYQLLMAGLVAPIVFEVESGRPVRDQRRLVMRCMVQPLLDAVKAELVAELETDLSGEC